MNKKERKRNRSKVKTKGEEKTGSRILYKKARLSSRVETIQSRGRQ
jgi:hypothetical protein